MDHINLEHLTTNDLRHQIASIFSRGVNDLSPNDLLRLSALATELACR